MEMHPREVIEQTTYEFKNQGERRIIKIEGGFPHFLAIQENQNDMLYISIFDSRPMKIIGRSKLQVRTDLLSK